MCSAVRDGKLERRAVSLGHGNAGDVEVMAGVNAGDELVVRGPENLQEGGESRNPPVRAGRQAGRTSQKAKGKSGNPPVGTILFAKGVSGNYSRLGFRVNPLTRPAPADENAGCGPPSPPKGARVEKSNHRPPRPLGGSGVRGFEAGRVGRRQMLK